MKKVIMTLIGSVFFLILASGSFDSGTGSGYSQNSKSVINVYEMNLDNGSILRETMYSDNTSKIESIQNGKVVRTSHKDYNQFK